MRVENIIQIEASPSLVWAVTEDIERWPEWTPTVTEVVRKDSGPFGLGSVARIKQPLQPTAEWVVTEFEPGRKFSWQTRRIGLEMVGGHELRDEGPGTRNVLSLEASGPLAMLLWPVLRMPVRRALSLENRGLKAHCEEIAKRR